MNNNRRSTHSSKQIAFNFEEKNKQHIWDVIFSIPVPNFPGPSFN